MIYIYDVVLNMNDFILESYEWSNEDEIIHVKRIPSFRIDKKVMEDICNYKIKFKDSFFNKLNDTCEIFKNRRIEKYNYLFLVTDLESVLALELNSEGKVIYYSRLLLDEEEDIISLSSRIDVESLEYEVLEKQEIIFLNTREELKKKNFLYQEFNSSYKKNDFNKLHFLYGECFNKKADSIDFIYSELIKSLEHYNKRHDDLYDLLLLNIKKQV